MVSRDCHISGWVACILTILAAFHSPTCAWAAVPEPDAIVYGSVKRNGLPATAMKVTLRYGVEKLAEFPFSAGAPAGSLYVVRAKLFHPESLNEPRPLGSVYINDTLGLYVDDQLRRYVKVTQRGMVLRIDLDADGVPPPTLTCTCSGDADKNRFVNASDFASVKANFGHVANATTGAGDADCNGFVNANDFAAVKAAFGHPCP
jgi:hypothetical protein